MIAGFESPSGGFCVIRFVRRVGLKVKALAYCNVEANVGDVGVIQAPDTVLQKGFVVSPDNRRRIVVCPGCRQNITAHS